jgi:hypothetical protein
LSESLFGWLLLLLFVLAGWFFLDGIEKRKQTRKQKRLAIQQAEAAPFRAMLRIKMDECVNEARLRAVQAQFFENAANDPNEPPEDVPRQRQKALNFDVQGHGMFLLAKTLEVIIGLPTKAEMVAQLERYAVEFRQNTNKGNAFEAAQRSIVAQGLDGVLADIARKH